MIVSVRGTSKANAVGNELCYGSAMDMLVQIGPNIEQLNPLALDLLTGIGLVVGINDLLYEEGLEPRARLVPKLEDEDEDEDDENEW